MKTSNLITTCTCCGADVTVPYFHNNKPYGYTCITKVTGKRARKTKSIWLQGKSINCSSAEINGIKFNSLFNVKENGLVRVTKPDGFPVWKARTMERLGMVQNTSKYDPNLKLKTWSIK